MAKTITGIVVSNKADKTIVVNSRSRHTHALYKKQFTLHTKFMAHDEKNEAKVGDTVAIVEHRPISARKHFILSEIIHRAAIGEDKLAAVKSTDTGQKDSKSKAKPEEETADKPAAKPAKEPKK